MVNLPLEIIELVLSHISTYGDIYTCLFISKHFYRATLPVLWHSPKRILSNGRAISSHYRHVYQCGAFSDSLGFFGVSNRHHIRQLFFGGAVQLVQITQLLPRIPLLTELVLSRLDMIDENMDAVARCCRHLRHITLHSLEWISPGAIVSLAQYCSQLTGISLADCPGIKAYALLPLLKTNGVKQLTVGEVPIESQEDICFDAGDIRLLSAATQFYYSTLTSPGAKDYSTPFIADWTCLMQFSSEWALQLTELCLHDIDDETPLVPLLETHVCLESLTLAFCHLGPKTLTAIARSLCDLRQLDLSGSYDFSAHNLKTMLKLGCPKLNLLVLTGCQTMTVDRLHRADFERWEPDMAYKRIPLRPPLELNHLL
ncbi:hypothetical protein [Absidia glauca]|uniref:F-box domain-containing protein n=1 Tax=Absidia glauca TaxID=4829 RepID=A0A168PYR0_ABSGL|nr:hypothetical protein [Absidia glauca]